MGNIYNYKCVFGFINRKIDLINNEIINSGKSALELMLELLPMFALWMELTRIPEDSGLLKQIAHKLSFILKHLFSTISANNEALGLIASNIAINMTELGSATKVLWFKSDEKL